LCLFFTATAVWSHCYGYPADRVVGNMMLINDNGRWCWYQDDKIIYDPVSTNIITSTSGCDLGFGGVNMPIWIDDLTSAQADKAFGNGSGQIGLSISAQGNNLSNKGSVGTTNTLAANSIITFVGTIGAEGDYCGDGICDANEDCSTCEADCGACGVPTWRVDARCFLDGPSGSFDDIAVKDPSIVYSGGKWHLFYTGRDSSMWRMGYATATSIAGLKTATHTFMSLLNGGSYFCAPQVFWFPSKGKWYLIYQSGLGATFSTNIDVNNPSGWTAGSSMGITDAGALDFWCISDGSYVYCFYSPMDGSHIIKWRRTTIADFPYNWSSASTAVTNTFEAPHVYKNNADGKYYMMVEDIGRYFELWSASSLSGPWTQVSERWAAVEDLIYNSDHWTDQVSHGEIIRSGTDERLEIDSINHCEILIQGVVNGNYGEYGKIPYDLGIIRQCPVGPGDLDVNCYIDFADFAILASQWLEVPGEPSADIAPPGGDDIVDFLDLGVLVDNWIQ
jgi:hypothetical protein